MNKHEVVAVTSRSFCKNGNLVNELKKYYSKVILNETGKTLAAKDLIDFLAKADKAIIGIEDMSADTLAQVPNLKVISKYGVGLNNIDLEYCKSQNIKLGFIPGVNKQSVAELALTLILISLRKIHTNHTEILNGEWPQEKGLELRGKKVGLLGFGNIGQTLAKLLSIFECEISFFDQRIFTENELLQICVSHSLQISNLKQKNLQNVLSESDIISIHLPLNDDTANIIDSQALESLQPSVVMVNTARGGIVQEEHLAKFLATNPDSFAAFDVFDEEPIKDKTLFNLDNFFGTSHRSSLTHEGINAMGMAAIAGLDDNIEIT
ncbi:phosphoglycerate dehydrogenase [Gammaproteobacteria bacterium]|jgi:D-3-phosphoglycerate dehydrogenase|nr:phosphoglycerate dehydrogenase [Gammaproteobacteria bacterium]|tara:strand:- start:1675 stop:2640 length:966 start_codon:yes stop_codon:yes gene_type:complete